MNRVQKYIVFIVIATFLVMVYSGITAQCPMCKTNLEGAMRVEGATVGAGINAGIVYLFTAPFIIAGTIGFMWYRNSRKKVHEINSPNPSS